MLQEDKGNHAPVALQEGWVLSVSADLQIAETLILPFISAKGFLHMPLNPLANCWEQPEKGGSIFTRQLLTCAKSVEDVPLCFVHPQLHWLTRMMGKLLGKLQHNKILASVPTQWHRGRHICLVAGTCSVTQHTRTP